MRKLLAFAFACLPLCAAAQTASITPEWAQIETIESDIRPGPAVWRVSRGESEVWILGTVSPLPKDLNWNRQYLAELIDGARALVTPPRASVGIAEGVWLLISYGGRTSLPRGMTLEAMLPEDMRARFIALRRALGHDEARYRTDTPVRAALRLAGDFNTKAGLNGGMLDGISNLADDKDVPEKPVLETGAGQLVRDVLTLPLNQQRICLGQMVDEINYQSTHARQAAQAWAVGDLRTIKANLSDRPDIFECVGGQLASVAQLREQAVTAWVDTIGDALNQKGKTIVLVGMRELLRKGGVLERLETRGLKIEGPAQ